MTKFGMVFRKKKKVYNGTKKNNTNEQKYH